jgi:hypothetical protein
MRNKGKIDAERQLDHQTAQEHREDVIEVDAEFDAAMNDMDV